MIKSILTTIVAIAILFGASFVENHHISKTFDTFCGFLDESERKLQTKSATIYDLEALEKFWLEKKRSLHVWIPHNDIKEIDLWVSECVAYVEQNKFDEAICKIRVLRILAQQIPNTFLLKLENIF